MNLASKLNNRVDIYASTEIINELQEVEKEFKLIRSCYCNIIPANNTIKTTVADTEYNVHTHKFRFRYNSIKDIEKDWYFMFEDRQYDVVSWDIDFKNREFIDVYASLRQE